MRTFTIRDHLKLMSLESVITVFQTILQFVITAVTAVPFWFVWNYTVPVYFSEYLPSRFHCVPYLHFVGLALLVVYVGDVISKLTPKFVHISKGD
jgi:hypothetical protein